MYLCEKCKKRFWIIRITQEWVNLSITVDRITHLVIRSLVSNKLTENICLRNYRLKFSATELTEEIGYNFN